MLLTDIPNQTQLATITIEQGNWITTITSVDGQEHYHLVHKDPQNPDRRTSVMSEMSQGSRDRRGTYVSAIVLSSRTLIAALKASRGVMGE